MFKTLVVALDLDDDGDRALPVVHALARRAHLRVDLVTVSEPGMPSAPDAYELERRAHQWGWDSDSWTIVHDIDAADGIVEHAARQPDPLVVMATTAKRPMSSSVFGSVTRDVLRRCRVPVLLIGPSVPSSSPLGPPSLVAAMDPDALDEVTVPAITRWMETFGGPAPRLVEVIGPFDDDRQARRRLEAASGELAARLVRAERLVVIADDPIAGLDEAADDLTNPVYVAVSSRYTDDRLHWHSTTQRLVAHAPGPVLVVPARALPVEAQPPPAQHLTEEHRAFHDRTTPAGDVMVDTATWPPPTVVSNAGLVTTEA